MMMRLNDMHAASHARGLGMCLLTMVLMLLPVSGWCECLLCNCSVSATGVAFGNYNQLDASPADAAGNVQVSCGPLLGVTVSYDITLSTGGSASYTPREMASGANQLQYNLYTTSGRSIVWGDGTAGTSVVSDSYLLGLLTTTRNYPVYGRIPAGQNSAAGAYADSITVTVIY